MRVTEMNEKQFAAEAENLAEVMTYVQDGLKEAGCPPQTLRQILLAVEEIFVNIAHYAYRGEKGFVTVKYARLDSPARYALWFCDAGVPFDPTARDAPDISTDLRNRQIGGLGIFLVREMMDKMTYTRENGRNIIYIEKQ
ncbi:MAG TPA: ATP-binding protein [Clostridiales bacterium]|nr:ATP-binding protein [Clostridiales bacterium]